MASSLIAAPDGGALTRRRALALLAAVGSAPAVAVAQGDQRVRLIAPSSPGSGTDLTARTLQPGLSTTLGAPVVVENITGASGLVGLQTLARAAPTDMTFVVITNNLVITPGVMKAFPFDVTRDFTAVAMLVSIPMVLVVNAARVPAKNAAEFIDLLKSKPGALNFGSAGMGTVLHLATEMFLDEAGVKARHIPYQGPSPMAAALIGGQIEFGTLSLSQAQPHLKSGALRAIGACTAKRTSVAPDIPTLAEQGLANYAAEAWVTLLGPKGMDSGAVKKVHDALVATFSRPEIKNELANQGSVVNLGTPEEARAIISRDLLKYAALIKKVGLEPQ
ncbi:ABC transporter substrate-binding protein [Variovorax sp. WS11]|uniref:Bug family tripartite tricarboxylate transporter substrate binding protein n=1 Tax=Variovorax sp. WS11 TaxID=1105204 RepID=UPI000D0D8812|nr:tripartite tricarboxylate transporter substrate-binding protein [Variovorax sp. WS11]NDZ18751.1 tripartite tricarboxylate transporter substrate binding protein [Variovorax sp. WS11]PSL82530.1 ABC transporter substrate-binding protein [Variovorax sp. WS11]